MMASENTPGLPTEEPSGIREEIKFSRVLTVVCLVILAAALGLLLWMVTFVEGVRLSVHESRDLERIASRLLGFESRLPDLSPVERMMFQLGGQDGETQEQIREWYEDHLETHANPLDEFYLGILYGEAGLLDRLRQWLEQWEEERGWPLLFRRVLEAAYLQDRPAVAYETLQARLAEDVPTNWFYFQVAQRLAEQHGDPAFQSQLQSQSDQLIQQPLLRWRVLVIGEVVLLLVGVFFLIRLGMAYLTGRVSRQSPGFDPEAIPWTFQEGVAVLARGGALSILVMGVVAVMPEGASILQGFGMVFLYFPAVILASMLLCRPRERSLLHVTGMRKSGQRLTSHLPLVFMVVALGLVGDWVIVMVGEAWQSSVHWSEWFVPQLVWGDRMELAKTAMEFVILAPVFEELIFRGILFSTLRKKFNFFPSMMASGLIFALAHGYGMVAFLTVLWSGWLWAWAYERTGSVIPGIVAHAINNGLVVYALVAMFR